jgi:uncharacterized protein with ParB-like and HNH nuclease domain
MSANNFQVIDGTVRSIQEMFTGRTYAIEYYQREYSWGKSNIEELILDLTRSFHNDYDPSHERRDVASYRPYFLGPVVTFSNEGVLFLVDGQQRMTSLSLLMSHLSSLLEPGDSQSQIKNLIYSTRYGQTTFTINVPEREKVMSAIREGHEVPPIDMDQSSQIIWERYNDIRNIFSEELNNSELPFFADWLLHRVVLVDIGTTDKDMALEIFESMNDRGLQLSNMDMLKSYLLSRIGYPEEIERANLIWRETTQALKHIDKNGDSDFMKALLRAKYAETVRDTRKLAGAKDFEEIATTFHKWTRDNSEKIGLIASPDFLKFVENHLVYFARRYHQLLDASINFKHSLEHVYYNAHNDFTLQYMVILAAVDINDDDEIFSRKANLIAAYIDIMITRRMAEYKNFGYSPMYRPMFALAKELRSKTLEDIREILKTRVAELNESIDSLKLLRLTKTNKPDIYYLLSRLTAWVGDEPASNYLERNKRDPFEVEHIWANKFDRHTDEFANESDFAEYRNLLGDLLLLPKSFNASYGALEYSVKVEHYFGQNPLAKSMNKACYTNNPNFLRKMKEGNLPFKAYAPGEFKRSAVEERQMLYTEIAKVIWSPGVLDLI